MRQYVLTASELAQIVTLSERLVQFHHQERTERELSEFSRGIYPLLREVNYRVLGAKIDEKQRAKIAVVDDGPIDQAVLTLTGIFECEDGPPQDRSSNNESRVYQSAPDRLLLWLQGALLGNVYSRLRAVAVGVQTGSRVTVRFYVDGEPSVFDREVLDVVCTELLSNTSTHEEIPDLIPEVVGSGTLGMDDVDPMSRLVFYRMDTSEAEALQKLIDVES